MKRPMDTHGEGMIFGKTAGIIRMRSGSQNAGRSNLFGLEQLENGFIGTPADAKIIRVDD